MPENNNIEEERKQGQREAALKIASIINDFDEEKKKGQIRAASKFSSFGSNNRIDKLNEKFDKLKGEFDEKIYDLNNEIHSKKFNIILVIVSVGAVIISVMIGMQYSQLGDLIGYAEKKIQKIQDEETEILKKDVKHLIRVNELFQTYKNIKDNSVTGSVPNDKLNKSSPSNIDKKVQQSEKPEKKDSGKDIKSPQQEGRKNDASKNKTLSNKTPAQTQRQNDQKIKPKSTPKGKSSETDKKQTDPQKKSKNEQGENQIRKTSKNKKDVDVTITGSLPKGDPNIKPQSNPQKTKPAISPTKKITSAKKIRSKANNNVQPKAGKWDYNILEGE